MSNAKRQKLNNGDANSFERIMNVVSNKSLDSDTKVKMIEAINNNTKPQVPQSASPQFMFELAPEPRFEPSTPLVPHTVPAPAPEPTPPTAPAPAPVQPEPPTAPEREPTPPTQPVDPEPLPMQPVEDPDPDAALIADIVAYSSSKTGSRRKLCKADQTRCHFFFKAFPNCTMKQMLMFLKELNKKRMNPLTLGHIEDYANGLYDEPKPKPEPAPPVDQDEEEVDLLPTNPFVETESAVKPARVGKKRRRISDYIDTDSDSEY
jgi:hypothetical protein